VIAHSDKDAAAATYKHTYGFHPILVTCDNTRRVARGEAAAGQRGANTATGSVALRDQRTR